ncbi:MAG: hypothetical protein ACRDB9_00455 [Cetobacterium sp.]
MVDRNLLYKSLEKIDRKSDINSTKYNKDIFIDLFNKYNSFKMEEEYYCRENLNKRCWIEIIEDGTWNLTLQEVKSKILKNIKYCRKYLYNSKKYGSNRFHIYENDNECYVFIYLRDIIGVDYNIWFENI